MNFYKHFIGDYQRDTMHLTMQQDGAYRRLLDACYATERALPADKDACYRLARAFNKDERDATDTVLDQFFPVGENGLRHNKRAIREVGAAHLLSEKARQASWSRESYGSIRSQRIRGARARGRHSDAEWSALLDFCGNVCVKCGSNGPLVKDHIIPICNGGSDSIQNLQPLCDSCNSSKGPDPTDYRKRGWMNSVREACESANDTANAVDKFSERYSERSSSHSHSHKEQETREPNGSQSEPAVPDCPQQAILALYAKHLPMLTQPRLWEGNRAESLRARWRQCAKKTSVWPGYKTQDAGLLFWAEFFIGVAAAPKLTLGIPRQDGSVWKPDLPWLLKVDNFAKVIERKYHT